MGTVPSDGLLNHACRFRCSHRRCKCRTTGKSGNVYRGQQLLANVPTVVPTKGWETAPRTSCDIDFCLVLSTLNASLGTLVSCSAVAVAALGMESVQQRRLLEAETDRRNSVKKGAHTTRPSEQDMTLDQTCTICEWAAIA